MSEHDRMIIESLIRTLKHESGTARRLAEELRSLLLERKV
jgi:hypothetical protein